MYNFYNRILILLILMLIFLYDITICCFFTDVACDTSETNQTRIEDVDG